MALHIFQKKTITNTDKMELTFEANMKSLGSHDQGLFQLLSYMYLFYYLNWISVAWNTSTVRYEKKKSLAERS